MRKYMSTGYAWIPDKEVTTKTQLHIYTFDNNEEWSEADAVLEDFKAKQEYLNDLGYISDPISVESIQGKTYTLYDMYLTGDFLIIEETVMLDV